MDSLLIFYLFFQKGRGGIPYPIPCPFSNSIFSFRFLLSVISFMHSLSHWAWNKGNHGYSYVCFRPWPTTRNWQWWPNLSYTGISLSQGRLYCVAIWNLSNYQDVVIGIQLTSLTPPHFCLCPQLGHGFQTVLVVVCFVFNNLV